MALGLPVMIWSCTKWKDKPAADLGLTRKYCNVPQAINYNDSFPGVEDNTTCIYPSDPFAGTYTFFDTIYRSEADTLFGPEITFSITALDTFRLGIDGFCSSRQLRFTADRYYNALSDTIIGAGTQLMCRDQDTLSGTLKYNYSDNTLLLSFTVVTDTGTVTHQGTAFKK